MFRPLLTLVAGAWLAAATSTDRNPLQSLSRIAGPVIQTANHRINSLSHFNLDFDLRDTDRRIRLTLEPNLDVVAEDTHVNYVNADGEIIQSKTIQRHEHKVFKGHARSRRRDGSWIDVGTARVFVHRDGVNPLFEGTFSINHDWHHIQLRSSYVRGKQVLDPDVEDIGQDFMVFFRDSDIKVAKHDTAEHTELKRDVNEYTCHAGQSPAGWNPQTGSFSTEYDGTLETHSFSKRQGTIDDPSGGGNTGGVDLSQTIGQTAGCPSTRKVALVGVATDCGYTSTFSSKEDVNRNVIKVMNDASGVFESSFNISLGLANITVMDADCPGTPNAATQWNQPCSANLGIQDRLNLFSTWRNTLSDNNSHWTLLTQCTDGTAVGLAWVGAACMTPSQGAAVANANATGAGANVVALTGTEWQVVAHETGHTFGAVHDCDSQTCANSQFVASGQCCPYTSNTCDADSRYIMNPFSTNGITHFSPCTIGNICSGIGRNSVHTQCLSDNRAVNTITGEQCGNGIVEGDEQCDCGDAEACADDPCCDGTTCKFANGAVCDDSNEDCCQNCQFSAAGSVCRASTSSCDPEETCPGGSALCPADVTAPDGQSCSISDAPEHVGALQCASGQCTSRNLQCVNVMGSYTNGNNDTYACDDDSCTLRCGSPAFGQSVCYEMQQNLLDGTVCGGGGHCSSGVCQGSNFGKEVENWIDEHKAIVIGVATAVGVLLLIAVLSCCCSCFRRRRRGKMIEKQQIFVPGPPDNSWYGPRPPNMQQQQPQHEQFQQSPAQQRSPGVWGHDSQAQQAGWRPSSPHPQSPAGSTNPALYGSGILGARGQQQPPPSEIWPQRPPPAYWGGGGGGMSSARYA